MRILPRSSWTTTKTPRPAAPEPMEILLIHHTVMILKNGKDATRSQEEAYWRAVRNVHLARGYPDIAYCHGVTPAGRVYELIGFGRIGIHTCNHNDQLAIVAAGNFEDAKPTPYMKEAIAQYLAIAVRKKHLKRGYKLRGHRDFGACSGATACPGRKLYEFLGWIGARAGELLHPKHHHGHDDGPNDHHHHGHGGHPHKPATFRHHHHGHRHDG